MPDDASGTPRHGVSAAPNRCQLTARVLSVQPSPNFPDKLMLRLRILDAEPIEGPLFARPETEAEAFYIGELAGLAPGRRVWAEAEFVGDPHHRMYQLHEVRMLTDG